MRMPILILTTILANVAFAAPALAEELGGGFSVNGSAAIVSDYRFRGISQSDRRFAVQSGLSVSHESGFYTAVWGSSIDDYVANGADAEIDLSAGYRKTFGGTTVDGGILYYYYPGSANANTDFAEVYVSVSHAIGPATIKGSAAYAPKQSALTIGAGDEDNLYLAADLSTGIPSTPFSLTAHLGHSFGPSYLTIGDEYTDWSLGATATWRNLTIGLAYVDTDGTFITPSGRNASKSGLVASLTASF